jgi:tripartite-type tricarboxylate transporter receptor subunit TctC
VEAVPDVPTIAEAGVPGYAATNWYGLLAPAKTPAAVIERINRELTTALRSPDVAEGLKTRGIDATPDSPAEFAAFIRAETVKWRPILQQSGIKADAP